MKIQLFKNTCNTRINLIRLQWNRESTFYQNKFSISLRRKFSLFETSNYIASKRLVLLGVEFHYKFPVRVPL